VINKILTSLITLVLPPRAAVAHTATLTEGTVLSLYQPRVVHGVVVLSSYQNSDVRALIHAQKFYGDAKANRLLALFLASWLSVHPPVAIIVPVPLHARRERERGYNHVTSVLTATLKALEKTGLTPPKLVGLLCRKRATAQQSHLTRANRLSNVAQAFTWNTAYDPASFAGQQIVLVDDVMTTGATLREAAAALRGTLPSSARVTSVALAH